MENLVAEVPRTQGEILIEAGYTPAVANHAAQEITESLGFKELLEKEMPETLLMTKHKQLLNSTRLDHMVFPLGPKDEDDINFSGGINAPVDEDDDIDEDEDDPREEVKERTTLTDQEIIAMLAEVNCKVRRIVHGNSARHVYFWAQDNKALKDALEMAYKIKGKFVPEPGNPSVTNYNFFYKPEIRALSSKYEEELEKTISDVQKT